VTAPDGIRHRENKREMKTENQLELFNQKPESLDGFIANIERLPLDQKVEALNQIRFKLHQISPFKHEPVDFVKWVKNDLVHANDYNPNSVAPPEMELLRLSIDSDGYTQPIVSMADPDGRFEVIDGFHRHRVGKECENIQQKVCGYLPLVQIRERQLDKTNRMASTIRHNRARGKHAVNAMSDIVIELKKRNWSDDRIAKELGMDSDEVLRLCQISGLQDVFSDQQFSQAWDATIVDDEKFKALDESDIESEEIESDRIFHEWEDWECFPAGFYSDKPPAGMSIEECEIAYRDFLSDIQRFESALSRLIVEWKNSCEHYLTNSKMNRIAWLGQASMCLESGIPSRFCGGYNLLSKEQQKSADLKALEYLNIWLSKNNRPTLAWEEAQSKTKADIY
jgi:ParB-like chromosome segregation protein Spo0J